MVDFDFWVVDFFDPLKDEKGSCLHLSVEFCVFGTLLGGRGGGVHDLPSERALIFSR